MAYYSELQESTSMADCVLIEKCPVCAAPHMFKLLVIRSHWLGAQYVHARPMKVTRLFTCPTTNEDFQVTIEFVQPHGEDYNEIIVTGVVPDAARVCEMLTANKDQLRLEEFSVPPGGVECGGLRILGIIGA